MADNQRDDFPFGFPPDPNLMAAAAFDRARKDGLIARGALAQVKVTSAVVYEPPPEPPTDPTLDLHRDIAARLGKGCARKRWEYYQAAARLADEQRARLDSVALVYWDRSIVAPEGDCDP